MSTAERQTVTAADVGTVESVLTDMHDEANKQLSAADVLGQLSNQRSKYASDDALKLVTTVGDYLPYIQLMSGNSDIVKEGKFPIGHFALTKNKNLQDIGNSFVALLLSWRPKAMQYRPTVLSFYDHKSQQFQEIQAVADETNSNKGYGPEFLIWLPKEKEFCTFFFGNKTCRMESPNLIACLEKGTRICKIQSHLIKKEAQKQSWHGPQMLNYDLPIDMPTDVERLQQVIFKFNNPPTSEAQPVEAAKGGTNDRR